MPTPRPDCAATANLRGEHVPCNHPAGHGTTHGNTDHALIWTHDADVEARDALEAERHANRHRGRYSTAAELALGDAAYLAGYANSPQRHLDGTMQLIDLPGEK